MPYQWMTSRHRWRHRYRHARADDIKTMSRSSSSLSQSVICSSTHGLSSQSDTAIYLSRALPPIASRLRWIPQSVSRRVAINQRTMRLSGRTRRRRHLTDVDRRQLVRTGALSIDQIHHSVTNLNPLTELNLYSWTKTS